MKTRPSVETIVRIRKHEAQVATWVKNSENPEFMEKQAGILAAAQDMEATSLRRRADAANGGSAPLIDGEYPLTTFFQFNLLNSVQHMSPL